MTREIRARTLTPRESGKDEIERLRRQVRRLSERNALAFDQGFQSAVTMVEAGADLHQLRAASGVVANDWEDTSPTSTRDISSDETLPVTADDFDGDTDVQISVIYG